MGGAKRYPSNREASPSLLKALVTTDGYRFAPPILRNYATAINLLVPEIHLSLEQARHLQLAAMGLLEAPTKLATKADVLAAIRAMHVLQIDTISVVARSPYLVLWSRLGDYEPRWLDELLAEGKLFEYWSHAACFLPIDDYPLYRAQQMNLEAHGFMRTPERIEADPVAHLNLLDHVRETGEVRAADFEHEGGRKGNGWWDWKPDKLRLETLYTAGEIMVARRERFHRIYDVRERVLPRRFRDEFPLPTRAEMFRTFTLNAIKAMGVVQARWIGDYFRHAGKVPDPHPDALVDTGELIRVHVEGWKQPAYVHRDHRVVLKRAANDQLTATYSTVLSPFDPLVWDRERALATWNFDYRIECYTPEAKRKYGYFTLPLLVNGILIGRLDAKAHRMHKVFELKSVHFEPMPDGNQALDFEDQLNSLAHALMRCARWHGAETVELGQVFTPNRDKKSERMLRTQLNMLIKNETDFSRQSSSAAANR
jgi:uncharacterized protein